MEAWAGVERDRWLYCFDTEDSILPDFEKPAPGMKRKVDEEQMFRDLGAESRQGKERKVKDPAMSKEAARRLSEEEDWETRPEPEPEEADGEAEEAGSREEKEAREMEEGYRDFEGEDEQEYQSFVQSLDM